MEQKLFIANWKMNGDLSLIKEYGELFRNNDPQYHVVVCPSFLHIWSAIGAGYDVGAQDCHFAKSGAHTGSISSGMLQDIGVKFVILGHSERRQNVGETDFLIQKKAKSAAAAGLIPIVCIGETLEDKEDERAFDVIRDQLQFSLPKDSDKYIVAYEPIWAIGTGKTATPDDIKIMHEFIKEIVPGVKVLYGGSVNAQNIKNIMELSFVDGVLVGSASLNVDEFKKMIF